MKSFIVREEEVLDSTGKWVSVLEVSTILTDQLVMRLYLSFSEAQELGFLLMNHGKTPK